jgi:hypothetical protein
MHNIQPNTVAFGLNLIDNSVTDAVEKRMLARWRAEYAQMESRRHRPAQILAAIDEGYDTLGEITFHTNIPRASVFRILTKLTREKRVSAVKTKNHLKRREFRFERIKPEIKK